MKTLKYLLLALVCSGCTVVSYNRVFPKLTWYWSAEAKEQRRSQQAEHEYDATNRPNVTPRIHSQN